jgi:hypothetical protein
MLRRRKWQCSIRERKLEREENRTSKRVQILGSQIQWKSHISVKKANKILGCVWGIGERKWGGDFRRKMMMFESMIRGRDLGMEETRRGRESARKIFERGARSGQSNTRVHSEGRVQGEQAESESGKEFCKVWRQNGWKGRVQDADGMLERKEKEQGEEREVLPEEQICQWISRKIKSVGASAGSLVRQGWALPSR